ncbi:MAG: hypothetical protein KDI03_09705, partial [Anaerolineae bacterium]|nr:hypothetical protein [Anaerolineae bacterium]
MSNSKHQAALRKVTLCSILVLLTLALLMPPTSVHAGSGGEQPDLATVVRCDPSTAIGIIGQDDLIVDMYIEDVVGLYGADLRISFFDTTIAQVVDQSPATGVQNQPLNTFLQPDFVVRNSADNTAGTMRYAANQIAPNPPVDGSGPVARITFHGLQAGTFIMTWGTIELSTIDGILIPATGVPCSITFAPPLAVTLANFEASPQFDHILARWETVSEIDNAGFNLYRNTSPTAPDQQLNATLIPSLAPGSGQGATYDWQDFDVDPGVTYFYWLETVALDGSTEMHGPVSATFYGPTAVTLNDFEARGGSSGVAWPLLLLALAIGIAIWKRGTVTRFRSGVERTN